MTLIAENKAGDQINLSNNNSMQLVSISGLNPPAATINMTEMAGADGSVFNSSKLGNRNIVIELQPVNNIENARLLLYSYIKSKKYIKLYITTDNRELYTEGYVESIEVDLNANPQMIQVSIICPDPYLYDVDETEMPISTTAVNILNLGDSETGFVTTFVMSGFVAGLQLTNSTTNKSFKLRYAFQTADILTLNTMRGQKSISLLRGTETINLINYIEDDTEWPQLELGNNNISFSADSGSNLISARVSFTLLYEGV